MSNFQERKNLITQIHSSLDTNQSLEPALRRAIRLADLCKKEEYRLLFEIHLDGIDINDTGRVRKWKDNKKTPKWNPLDVYFSDRKVETGETYLQSIKQLEHNLKNVTEAKNKSFSDNLFKHASAFIKVEIGCFNVLSKIRNRISLFLREAETDIDNEIEFLRKVKITMANYNEKEYRVLKLIYDKSSGIPDNWILIDVLEKELKIPFKELNSILIDLEQRKGLIGSVEQAVWIVPAGIEEIEKTRNYPNQSTDNFPANIYNNTFNAPVMGIQQGGKDNTQHNTQNINPDFTKAINDLLSLIEDSSLNQLQKINVKSDVQIIKDLADLEKSPEVLELANSKIEAVKEVISMTADMTSLGMVLMPIIQAVFGN